METKRRILVVDDEDIFRDNLVRMLCMKGYQAEGASGGHEALDVLGAREFDVVLLDLKMPDMDGEEVLRRMREEDIITEVVVLTGHASLSSAVTLIQEGAFDYQLKPYEQQGLLRTIELALENRRLRKDKPSAGKSVEKERKGLFKLFS